MHNKYFEYDSLDNYSFKPAIHTADLILPIDRDTSELIKKQSWVIEQTSSKYGINYLKSYYSHGCYYLEIIINLAKLLNNGERLFYITNDNIDILALNADNILKELLGIQLPSILNWKVSRIDYAVDIITEDIDLYVYLFKNSKVQRPKTCKNEEYDTSIYRVYGTYRLNIYDKEHERINNCSADVEYYKNLLRIEVQCEKEKLKYIKSKYKLDDRIFLNYLDTDIAAETIISYIYNLMGTASHYKYKDALDKLHKSKASSKMKTALSRTLDRIYEVQNIQKLIEEDESKRTIKQHLKELDMIGINPLLLPDDCEKQCLPNIINLI